MALSHEDRAILGGYTGLIDFLVAVYGESCEIALFEIDPDTAEGSVVAARGGSYRTGDPMSPIAGRILRDAGPGTDYLVNINTDAGDQQRRKQSYFFIRNGGGQVIGLLSVGFPIDALIALKTSLDQILGYSAVGDRPQEHGDLYHELDRDFSISKYVKGIVAGALAESGVPAERMTIDEKAALVGRLVDMEVFTIKGSVQEVAAQLQVSQATLYRLMKR